MPTACSSWRTSDAALPGGNPASHTHEPWQADPDPDRISMHEPWQAGSDPMSAWACCGCSYCCSCCCDSSAVSGCCDSSDAGPGSSAEYGTAHVYTCKRTSLNNSSPCLAGGARRGPARSVIDGGSSRRSLSASVSQLAPARSIVSSTTLAAALAPRSVRTASAFAAVTTGPHARCAAANTAAATEGRTISQVGPFILVPYQVSPTNPTSTESLGFSAS